MDDVEDTARTMAMLVKSLGHKALALTDAREALAAIEMFLPEIAFLDIGMPAMDGWTLAGEIRKRYPPETLRLVALTAYVYEEHRARSREAGFDAHLAKPASGALIHSTLATFFRAN